MSIKDKLNKMAEEAKERESIKIEEGQKLRDNFKPNNNYNRGTVIAAAAKAQWSDYYIKDLLEKIDTPEKAEAAVGLIEAGNSYNSVVDIIKYL